ncbi:ABC transporter permease [Mycoplasmopsis opalescens]|uniref:ABC transporter permease n=1 Tax=Mycoplasmopsis opalescens TaxID=114886 RepID=UPI0004A71C4E|nr:ABC transporter permease [Mycoplasmopsis opalescens]
MNLKNKLSVMKFNKRLSLLMPFFLIALIFIVLPILLIIIRAFTPIDGFDSFKLVKSIKNWKFIGRSIFIGIIAALLCLVIALPYSYFIARNKSKILPIYALSLMLSPMAIFTIAKIYAIRGFFLSIVPADNLENIWFMILALTYLNLPFMIMPLYSILKDMPNNIIEASEDLGYNKFQTIVKVVMPYAYKAIISGFSLIFLSSATTFVISDKLLSRPKQLQTIGSVINAYANPTNEYDFAQVSTLVLVVIGVFIACYAIINFTPKIIKRLIRGGKNV